MTQKQLTEKLNKLSAITPNEEFARVSRSVILSSVGIPVEQVVRQGIFSRGISFTLSVGFTAVLFLVLVLGSSTGSFKTFFLPTLNGVNSESLVSEADMITKDIDIKLDEIQYFHKSRQIVAFANDIALYDDTKILSDGEDEIDKLLEEIIQY